MQLLNLIIFTSGFHAILLGIYLFFQGIKKKKAMMYLGVFMVQVGIDLVFSFFQMEKMFYEFRTLFYIPVYLVTLPTVSIFSYFVEVLEPTTQLKKIKKWLWSIPLLEFIVLLIIFFQHIAYQEDLWLSDTFYLTKVLHFYVVQGVNLLLGFVIVYFVYTSLKQTIALLKKDNLWSVDVINSVRWLQFFLLGYFIFHFFWSILISFDALSIGGNHFYEYGLPYVYTFAAILTYWISFKAIRVPKIVTSPWNPLSTKNQIKSIFEAIQEKKHPILITNSKHIILHANSQLLSILKFGYTELQNKSISVLLNQEDLHKIYNLDLLNELDKPQKSEFMISGKNDAAYGCEVEAHIASDEKGRPSSFIFYFMHLKQLSTGKNIRSQYQKNLKSTIEKLLNDKKVYKDPTLSLDSFSDLLHISTRYTSTLVNELFDKNFRDLINEYRVNEVKMMLQHPDYKDYSLLSIGLEAGFNSKSTFHAAFKKHTGLTPMKYQSIKNRSR
ncbi:helix-turn-helix domain-containing protein [Aquimarina sp. U1-2]|uniref:helix-turn-helix domain-containing protein n=1 Tax=Aquimarina sp. U1-2 TaxID=2823141 RepID=UPI001AEC8017|nr:helix-turn-helix domain-containing protein [Aquimarina sp. U1-2]MBP2832386.1 helix-turn-helix domain-containing protein [Aquimarina sp. U1-2]